MIKVDLHNQELNEFRGKNKPDQHCRATFPLLGSIGSKASAMVLVELDRGDRLGRHTDSAEETLLVLDGKVEVTVGEETGELRTGEIALVPKMVPHDIRNVGDSTARIIGFFGGANNIVATFDETWMPTDSNVVDTSQAPAPKVSVGR